MDRGAFVTLLRQLFLPRALALGGFAMLVALPAAGQDLQLMASPNPAAVYQKVTLSVIVPAKDPSAVSASFPESSGEIHVVSGPYIQPYLDNAQPSTQKVRVSYVIEGNEPGRTIIGPLSITVGSAVEKTDPMVMAVGVLRGNEVTVPLQPVWKLPEARPGVPLYTGEAIPVVLELKNEARVTKVDEVHVSQAPPGLLRISELDPPSRTQVGQTTLYQVPVASYLLTATGVEDLILPAAQVQAGARTGTSIPRQIQINPIPEAISASGAIGALAFRSWTTEQKVADGEEVSLHLRVEGTGNLPRIVMPVPAATGILQIDKNETRNVSETRKGFSGFREIVYRYLYQGSNQPADTPVISVPSFSWLDPETGSIESVPERTFPVSTPPAIGPAMSPSDGALTGAGAAGRPEATGASATGSAGSAGGVSRTLPALPYTLESAAAIRSSEYRELYSRGDTYLWLLPGPVIFGLFLLVRPRPRKGSGGLTSVLLFGLLISCSTAPIHDSVEAGMASYNEGKLEKAASDFGRAANVYPRNAALSFDRGIVEYRLGRYGEAIHFLRAAIFYSPLTPTYRSALEWTVSQIGVPEQVAAAYPVHPDIFLIALIVAVNAASILGILVLLRRSGGLAIALILLLVLSVISAGGLGYTAVKRSVQTAVVRSSGTEMTKIPMASAGRWLELPAGMAVRVRDSAGGYYLVETAYGNTGWVKHDRVLLDAESLQAR